VKTWPCRYTKVLDSEPMVFSWRESTRASRSYGSTGITENRSPMFRLVLNHDSSGDPFPDALIHWIRTALSNHSPSSMADNGLSTLLIRH
jgi:hypothetical protein